MTVPDKKNHSRALFELFTGEKARGALASCISGILANAANAGLIIGFGVNPMLSTALVLQLGGNLLTYMLDIVIAKRLFGGIEIPYTEVCARFKFFALSLLGPMLHKFVVASIIEAAIVYVALNRAIRACDHRGIHFPLRDPILAGIIASITFILFMNILRFNWVYEENDSMLMNCVILSWMGLSSLIVLLVVTPVSTQPSPPHNVTSVA